MTQLHEAVDPFTDAAPEDTTGLATDAPDVPRTEIPRHDVGNGRLFAPTADELHAEALRVQDRQVGLLIGQKNLEKLRGFGFDVVAVNPNRQPLTAGISHRGMTE